MQKYCRPHESLAAGVQCRQAEEQLLHAGTVDGAQLAAGGQLGARNRQEGGRVRR